jgi:hypothetical protein
MSIELLARPAEMRVWALRPAESVSFQPRKPASCKRSTFRETLQYFRLQGLKFSFRGSLAPRVLAKRSSGTTEQNTARSAAVIGPGPPVHVPLWSMSHCPQMTTNIKNVNFTAQQLLYTVYRANTAKTPRRLSVCRCS